MVPKAGPINGNQYRTTMISGFSFFNSFPTLIQFKRIDGINRRFIFRSAGAAVSAAYCVFPGNRKRGVL